MTIEVQCGCGKSFRVKDEMGGKRGRCPACGGVLDLPLPSGKTTCFCGHEIEFRLADAGKTRPCPGCSRPVFLTDSSRVSELDIETEEPPEERRCPACGSRVLEVDTRSCTSCGANLRTGQVNLRRSLSRGRLGQPRPTRGGVPVARVAAAEAEPRKSPAAKEPPAPVAMPGFQDEHVQWKDTAFAGVAEDFAEEFDAERLDFTPQSLTAFEFYLEQARAAGSLEACRRGAACYFGEVVARNLGGVWRRAKDGREVIAHLPGERSLDPAAPIARALERQPAGGLVDAFVDLARELGLLA